MFRIAFWTLATAAGLAVIGYAELVAPERLRAAGAVATVHALSEVASLLGALLDSEG